MPQLPTEIIEHCISFIDVKDKQTLAAACKASRVCNQAATPLLYGSIGIPRSAFEGHASDSRLRLQYRTLVQRPALARYPTILVHDLQKRPLSPETSALVHEGHLLEAVKAKAGFDEEACRDFRLSYRFCGDRVTDDEPWLLLLLVLCPNIRCLELTGRACLHQNTPLLNTLLCFESKRIRPAFDSNFMRIERVTMTGPTEEKAVTALDIGWMLFLPPLRSLTVYRLAQFDPVLGAGAIDGPQVGLRVLDLKGCDHNTSADIMKVLVRCGNLQHLNIEFASYDSLRVGQVGWQALGRTLTSSCPRLESIRLDCSPEWSPEKSSYHSVAASHDGSDGSCELPRCTRLPQDDSFGDLRSLQELKTLTVLHSALLGIPALSYDPSIIICGEECASVPAALGDILPPSLKHLTVVREDEDLQDWSPFLRDPFVKDLEECTILNLSKTHWQSTSGGEGKIGVPEAGGT